MTFVPFPEWRPDVSDYQANSSITINNVLPRGDGYGPFPGFSVLTSALPGACRGYFRAIDSTGAAVLFAATATKLYKLNNTTLAWADVSLGAGSYSAIPSGDQWQFVQFNNFVIAVQVNVAPQVWDLTSSTAFAALGGSPPQARYIAVVNRFLVLSGISGNPYRVQWSGLNATTTWDNVTAQSNFQDLADGGLARCVVGGEYGIICQDAMLRRMVFAPGSSYTFQIEKLAQGKGIFAPLAVTVANDKIFFILNDGFHMLEPSGGYPTPIGKEKFDRTFFADVDSANLQLCMAASSPRSTVVLFAYKSINGAPGGFDKILAYDYALGRATLSSISGEYLASVAKPGITLEGLDSISSSIDALTFSLDDVSVASLTQLSGFNSSHQLSLFSGPALEATLETAEQGDTEQRMRVRGIVPATDASTGKCSIRYRETLSASPIVGPEASINVVGKASLNRSCRFARFRLRVPASSAWSFASGVGPDVAQLGNK